MVQTLMPRDAHNQSIQTLAPEAANAITIGVASARTAGDFTSGVKVVELRATQPCFIKFGDGSVTAVADGTDSFFLSGGERVTYHVGENTRVAAIRQTANDGTLFITELA
jgi:hypothetical protein